MIYSILIIYPAFLHNYTSFLEFFLIEICSAQNPIIYISLMLHKLLETFQIYKVCGSQSLHQISTLDFSISIVMDGTGH